MRLQGKVVIVTGDASGFGAQIHGDKGRHSTQGSQGPFRAATCSLGVSFSLRLPRRYLSKLKARSTSPRAGV